MEKTIGFFNVSQSFINDDLNYKNYNKIIFKGDGGILTKIEHIYKEKYSYTHKKEADYLSSFIKDIVKNDLNNTLIVDGTTSLGGNLKSFIYHFKNIIGIEINQIRFNKLLHLLNLKFKYVFSKNKENIFSYKTNKKNIILINDSFNKYIENICKHNMKNIIIYLDPPWGGKNYKEYNNIILGLAGFPLHLLVENIKKINKDTYIILKLPLNYYLESFTNIKEIKNMEKFYYIFL